MFNELYIFMYYATV